MTRQRATRPPLDAGITLVEVMVAMLVFAILASGVVAGMATITRLTADSRARIVAANLASQDLDLVRAIGDPFQISASPKKAVTVGLRTFYVQRAVSWVSSGGVDLACNSSTNLFYLRVNTRVTWAGQLSTTRAVQDDTIIAPAGRVSAESTGAISISVVDAAGEPEPGIGVRIEPVSSASGKALTTQPASTTAAGCTYATNISPGTYRATVVTKTGWVDPSGNPNPSVDITVTAGTTHPQQFQFDQAATATTTYKPINGWTGAVVLPTALQATFLNTSLATGRRVVPTVAASTPVKLFPFPSGYSVLAGTDLTGTTNCSSVDPAAWTAGTVNGVALGDGVRPVAVYAAGTTTAAAVPVGVVRVKTTTNYRITVTPATTPGPDDPGCGITDTAYTFTATSTTPAIVLPFGSWRIAAGTAKGTPVQVTAANLTVLTNAAGAGVAPDGTVTLDPRPRR